MLDGDGALAKLEAIFRPRYQRVVALNEPGQLLLGRIVDARGELVDEALAAPLAPKESATGCEQIELSCHGGVGASAAVCRALEEAGFRRELPGELFARAHRAARLGLPDLEARLRLPGVETARQAEFLLSAAALQEDWERFGLEVALGTRERRVDWRERVYQAASMCLDRAPAARRLLRTHRVVIAGPVNAGKSTLANRLLRAEASIVSAEPGTTRDRLERQASLRGLSVLLSDTAGLRDLAVDSGAVAGAHSQPASHGPGEPQDGGQEDEAVERESQARALQAAQEADLVLIVVDGSRAPSESEVACVELLAKTAQASAAARPLRTEADVACLLVFNKVDRGLHAEAEGLAFTLGAQAFRISAQTGEGAEALEQGLESALLGGTAPTPGALFTRRQQRSIETLKAGLEEGLDGTALVGHIRNLLGTRPNEEELAAVFREAEEEERAQNAL